MNTRKSSRNRATSAVGPKVTPVESFLALSDAEKAAAVAEFDRDGKPAGFGPLPPAQQKQWQRVRQKLGRPRKGQGAEIVSVSIERGLLRRADREAKRRGVGRSELVARGLELALAERTDAA